MSEFSMGLRRKAFEKLATTRRMVAIGRRTPITCHALTRAARAPTIKYSPRSLVRYTPTRLLFCHQYEQQKANARGCTPGTEHYCCLECAIVRSRLEYQFRRARSPITTVWRNMAVAFTATNSCSSLRFNTSFVVSPLGNMYRFRAGAAFGAAHSEPVLFRAMAAGHSVAAHGRSCCRRPEQAVWFGYWNWGLLRLPIVDGRVVPVSRHVRDRHRRRFVALCAAAHGPESTLRVQSRTWHRQNNRRTST